MHDNAGTSDSADSSGGSSSPLASSDASGALEAHEPQGLRVDFYILEESSATARLKLACRLAEKAYLAAQTALVWHTDTEELKAFDELLWTFMDGSFVPHEMLTGKASSDDSPVLLSAGMAPPADFDVIINLAPAIPGCLSKTRRIAEIIDGDDARRRA